MSEIKNFYHFPEFQIGQERKLLLLQVDIEGHSKLSKEKRAADVMKMKAELAEELAERLLADGYKGMDWQGDGGMFALDVGDNVELVDKTVSSWRIVRHVADTISDRYKHLLDDEAIPLRTSAHVCHVHVHSDPRYWHSEGINEFAKAERELGRRNKFVITGELFRDLPEQAKKEFEMLPQTVKVGTREDVYGYAGVPGDRNMDFILAEMESIVREAKSFRSALRTMMSSQSDSDLATQSLLIIVDLQKDFGGERPLAVQNAEELAAANHELAKKAMEAGIAVVVTRDWHPEDHFSFETWHPHCVAGKEGAEFIEEFNYSELDGKCQLAGIGLDNAISDYNPYYDSELAAYMSTRAPEKIYVSGIALEYCVLATCLASKAYSENVVALESFIRSAKCDKAEIAWKLLEEDGINRELGSPFDD